jgi:hypothetical protein
VKPQPRKVPYFCQWESRELISDMIAKGEPIDLVQDALWPASGAITADEYVIWARHVCGMVCLKMILAARTGQIVPTLTLARACTAYGGYAVDAGTGEIKGLIYAPFVRFIDEAFGIRAEVITDLTARELPALFERAEFFMASVNATIRWPDRDPPRKGGHLVLALEASDNGVVFHNPSGHILQSQENVSMGTERFDRYFAGRGVAILR